MERRSFILEGTVNVGSLTGPATRTKMLGRVVVAQSKISSRSNKIVKKMER
jgi:hypothetical protein